MSLRGAVLAALAACGAGVVHVQKSGGLVDTVRIEMYYESMCPYCEQLLAGSLTEIWNAPDFRSRVNLELHPFGNAMVVPEDRISKGYHFFHPDALYPVVICQHKEQECLGNALQACAISKNKNEVGIPLVLCMANQSMAGHGLEMAAYDCMQELGIDTDEINRCAQSQEGKDLIVQHGEATRRPELNISYVPWVLTEGVQVVFDDAHDLIKPLCSMLAPPLPALCSRPSAAPAAATATGLLSASGGVFTSRIATRPRACYREEAETEHKMSLLQWESQYQVQARARTAAIRAHDAAEKKAWADAEAKDKAAKQATWGSQIRYAYEQEFEAAKTEATAEPLYTPAEAEAEERGTHEKLAAAFGIKSTKSL